ncbi:MAG: dihydroorotate dehydrogenase electron transfer subunit [Verrucomicrobiae bacterium]|nr:dihydroorotate dehydrogenase electron transfer subunit [Verrucomicrobiae bacterium]
MVEQDAIILANDNFTGQYYRLVLQAEHIAPLVQPGQFVHIRVPLLREALLRRPFSIFQVRDHTLSVLYKTVGKGTHQLSRLKPGQGLSVIGPLGHGFTIPSSPEIRPLLVAGGYGMAALYLLAERSPRPGIVFVGGRKQGDILCENEFRALGWEVRATTEDGSYGIKGLVTQPLREELQRGTQNVRLHACGPNPMLKAVSDLAREFNVEAELSMDEHMCCGVGVCLTCVIPIRSAEGWEYQRTCTEGPVFNAHTIAWEVMA